VSNQELREKITREVLGSNHIRYVDLIKYAKQNPLDDDRKQSIDNIMKFVHSHMQDGFDYVIGEDPKPDTVTDNGIGYSERSFGRRLLHTEQRDRASKYLKGEL
jgi:hypothetical protein